MRKKFLAAASLAVMAVSLQGCAVWEWAFGGPDPEDMNEIIMRAPVVMTTAPAMPSQPQAPQFPTTWQNGQASN